MDPMNRDLGSEFGTAPLSSDFGTTPVGDFLNKILRGEISAVEAYDQVIEKFQAEPEAAHLRDIRAEHEDSVERLRALVRTEGHQPSEASGVWGGIVASVIRAAKLTGNETSLKALLSGEEHGLKQYREALEMDLFPEEETAIRDILIPRQERHISGLSTLARVQ